MFFLMFLRVVGKKLPGQTEQPLHSKFREPPTMIGASNFRANYELKGLALASTFACSRGVPKTSLTVELFSSLSESDGARD
ncbi:hypothetical protein F2Q69_00004656 [Brassica cretica]|uniref:Uncharacterized protein n=1 Tax=Brassica cretica TaxID=69181 RepID=A0A8S9PCZ3_BRACR|nr:hypothetical protein F2Q69_00004656 [Brassica cretica]